jgi:hypothetical protein
MNCLNRLSCLATCAVLLSGCAADPDSVEVDDDSPAEIPSSDATPADLPANDNHGLRRLAQRERRLPEVVPQPTTRPQPATPPRPGDPPPPDLVRPCVLTRSDAHVALDGVDFGLAAAETSEPVSVHCR